MNGRISSNGGFPESLIIQEKSKEIQEKLFPVVYKEILGLCHEYELELQTAGENSQRPQLTQLALITINRFKKEFHQFVSKLTPEYGEDKSMPIYLYLYEKAEDYGLNLNRHRQSKIQAKSFASAVQEIRNQEGENFMYQVHKLLLDRVLEVTSIPTITQLSSILDWLAGKPEDKLDIAAGVIEAEQAGENYPALIKRKLLKSRLGAIAILKVLDTVKTYQLVVETLSNSDGKLNFPAPQNTEVLEDSAHDLLENEIYQYYFRILPILKTVFSSPVYFELRGIQNQAETELNDLLSSAGELDLEVHPETHLKTEILHQFSSFENQKTDVVKTPENSTSLGQNQPNLDSNLEKVPYKPENNSNVQ
jgi:hypothetical protein